jgi:response regulator of citrate/malate metabolism
MDDAKVEEKLDNILFLIRTIDEKLDRLLQEQHIKHPDYLPGGLDVMTLLSLPDHLRTTAVALFEAGVSTAEELAEKTSKKRAVESSYLNQLVRMGHVRKFRKGRKVFFEMNSS